MSDLPRPGKPMGMLQFLLFLLSLPLFPHAINYNFHICMQRIDRPVVQTNAPLAPLGIKRESATVDPLASPPPPPPLPTLQLSHESASAVFTPAPPHNPVTDQPAHEPSPPTFIPAPPTATHQAQQQNMSLQQQLHHRPQPPSASFDIHQQHVASHMPQQGLQQQQALSQQQQIKKSPFPEPLKD